MGCVKEGWPQQVAEEGKQGVDGQQNGFCHAHGLTEKLCVFGETDDRDHDLAQAHTPTG